MRRHVSFRIGNIFTVPHRIDRYYIYSHPTGDWVDISNMSREYILSCYPPCHTSSYNHRQIVLASVNVDKQCPVLGGAQAAVSPMSPAAVLCSTEISSHLIPGSRLFVGPRSAWQPANNNHLHTEEKTTTIYFHSLIFPQADKRLSGPSFVTF